MQAVSLKGGDLSLRATLPRDWAAMVNIATGGSLGREVILPEEDADEQAYHHGRKAHPGVDSSAYGSPPAEAFQSEPSADRNPEGGTDRQCRTADSERQPDDLHDGPRLFGRDDFEELLLARRGADLREQIAFVARCFGRAGHGHGLTITRAPC